MNIKALVIAASAGILLASCSSSKVQLPYFSDIESTTAAMPAMDYLSRIVPDDELVISVNSVQPEATAAFNMPYTNPAVSSKLGLTTTPQQQTYRVDSKGDIYFPVLGKLHVEGMTVEELREKLTEMISKDVSDPLVTVAMANFRVYVGGEVQRPQPIEVKGNRITVLEALSAAGDLTEFGMRENVLVIREENGKRTFERLNLNKAEALTSPYYYLQPNDYVYVSPNEVRQANSKYNQNNAYKVTVISTIVSAASVIASLVIALTVK